LRVQLRQRGHALAAFITLEATTSSFGVVARR
jgi:hypothetical protein